MTYVVLNNLIGLLRSSVGQWWFDSQAPIDWGPALVTVSNYHGDDDGGEDDTETYPLDHWETLPKCKKCKGPNYSLENKNCLTCRLGVG